MSCDQKLGFPPGPPTYTVTLSNQSGNCQVGTLTFGGSLTATGNQGDSCLSIPSSVTLSTQNLTVQSQTPAGTTTATFNLTNAAMALSCVSGPCECNYDQVSLTLNGTMSVVSTNGQTTTTQAAFDNTSMLITVDDYAAPDHCVPVAYTMVINGGMTLTTDSNSFDAIYTAYTLTDDSRSGQDLVTISGLIRSDSCFGAGVPVILSTTTLLTMSGGSCPIDGSVQVMTDTQTDVVTYNPDGSVEINVGGNGTQNFPSCLDPALYQCPAS